MLPHLVVEDQARPVTDRCSHLHCPARAAHCVHMHVCVHMVHVYYCVHMCPCTHGCTRCTCQRVHACPCTFWHVWVCRHVCTQPMCVSVHMCMHMWARVCVVWVHAHTWCMCTRAQTSARSLELGQGPCQSLSVRRCPAPTAALFLRRLLRWDKCRAELAQPGSGHHPLPIQQACGLSCARPYLCSLARSHGAPFLFLSTSPWRAAWDPEKRGPE